MIISILCYNNQDIIKDTLDSYASFTTHKYFKFWLFDNGSSKPIDQSGFPKTLDIKVFRRKSNVYFSGGMNWILDTVSDDKLKDAEWCVVSNSDAVINLDQLVNFYESWPVTGGVIGFPSRLPSGDLECVERKISGFKSVSSQFGVFRLVNKVFGIKAIKSRDPDFPMLRQIDVGVRLQDHCIGFRIELIRNMRIRYDERLKLYFNEDELFEKLHYFGVYCFLDERIETCHLSGGTLNQSIKAISRQYRQDSVVYLTIKYNRLIGLLAAFDQKIFELLRMSIGKNV